MLKRLTLLLCLLLPAPLRAGPELCEAAARQAGAESGLPPALLLAISLVETGRDMGGERRPWPWSANLEGQGHRFANRAELAGFARQSIAAGRPSLDLGCFQINWRWHGAGYSGPEALTDPLTGARHAARYLRALEAETGSLEEAIGAYHSRDPARAARYRQLVAAALPGGERRRLPPETSPPEISRPRTGPSLATSPQTTSPQTTTLQTHALLTPAPGALLAGSSRPFLALARP